MKKVAAVVVLVALLVLAAAALGKKLVQELTPAPQVVQIEQQEPECVEDEVLVRRPFPEGELRCVHVDDL